MDDHQTRSDAVLFPAGVAVSNPNPLRVTMETLIRRPAGSGRSTVWALVLPAFLVGAVGASVLFVGVWRNEASRAKSADSDAQKAAEVLSVTSDKLNQAETRLRIAQLKLRRSQATVQSQAADLRQLGAAGKPVADDAASLDAAAQQLSSEGAGLGDSVTKLTNAVAALSVYLKQTSVSELDPAYLDAQLSYLKQALASLQTRSERLKSGAGSVAASRQQLAADVAELQRLAGR
jgi:chromosome segregation ATPase